MKFEMKMPDLATTGSEIRVVRWIASPGDRVKRGQPVLEIETDKATMEVEATVDGVLATLVAAENALVATGEVIATLDVADASPAAAASTAPAKPGGMFARNRAVKEAATSPASAPSSAPVAKTSPGVALSPAQLTAARRLQESKRNVPHFYLQTSFNAQGIIRRRKDAAERKLAWDAFFVHAVAKAIKQFGRMSMRLEGERLVLPPSDAIGVAVDAGGELFVIAASEPVTRSIEAISEDIRVQAEHLRAGDASARRLPQVAMTITNLGSCNVESFIPIVNPPEAAILGIGKVTNTCVARDDGRIAVQPRATLTLAVDHRVVSGKYAGDFLGAMVNELESFDRPTEP
jgi:pyruvate dehydrogenase E2 component (dihydrolipoamide acetyltransferase)